MQQNWLARSCNRPFKTNDNIFLHKSKKWEKEIFEHELIYVLIKLVGEKFIKSKSFLTLFSIHPSIWSFGFISHSCSDFSSHPFKGVIMLEKVPVKSPNFISSFYLIYIFRKTIFQSFCIFLNNWIGLWILVWFLRLSLFFFVLFFTLFLLFFLFALLFVLSILVNKLMNITVYFWVFCTIFLC